MSPSFRKTRIFVLVALIGACASPDVDRAPTRPPDVSSVPDAVPRAEPRSASGNPPFYEVNGRRYHVMDSSHGYRKRGVASWYGEKFHGRRTSSGETYDMYLMTAAHKTLPLPAYARVTNLGNGRSVVVKINDRGPFVDNRIIDLSYAAANRLDMIRAGTAMVEVEVLDPSTPPRAARAREVTPQAADGSMYIQAGAFRSKQNAESLARRVRAQAREDTRVFIRHDSVDGEPIYRVRIGPVAGVDQFDRLVEQMARIGISDAYLALD
jgi:rare lipoprotein A